MNDKLKSMAKKAGLWETDGSKGGHGYVGGNDAALEAFAKLVAEDCANRAEFAEADPTVIWSDIRKMSANAIRVEYKIAPNPIRSNSHANRTQ